MKPITPHLWFDKKDKYGLSWQIVPTAMNEMLEKGTPEQLARVTQAFLRMKKFDIAELQKAFDGVARVELAS
jgi:predicted 3-demethylubiquinone-9 3-methyltransferase (glyoxalase superfamily)